ncbi:threonine synthase [Poritiphilus flavus]|uniref:Threonine synthase n=1 Tax=Poritiphilus flavus TaxID=2697053 RepID=A0A6L9EBN7_9FLAO|nr:threonine synthase [Poritiphilus flavus]NAS12114.1 threonine synthase [Poritiphilus flavus]
MKFYSLNKQAPEVSFKEAVIRGIAPDKGLYFPEYIPQLPEAFFETIDQKDSLTIAYEAMKPFVQPDIPDEALKDILRGVLDFDFPLVEIEEKVSALELFHGPTMAFKDVGARFMARCLGYFFKDSEASVTVLVATSGDTGGAVANGFLGVKGVNVVILYPDGKVSDIQERQLTTLGQNISALRVDGTFDDCQDMVKRAFLDEDLRKNLQLTSANSINVARWLPQLLYYLFAYKNAKTKSSKLVFSVPSGNFGNICAGMVARRMGMPCDQFIAATNINDTVPEFMRTKAYRPKPSSQTISNAMDVGDPSNFVRIRHLYNDSFDALEKELSSYAFTDDMTRNAIAEIHANSAYIADPHGAVGYLGLKAYQKEHPDSYGIFLETAHPVKFIDVVENTLGVKLEIPVQIKQVMGKEKHSEPISSYDQLKTYLLRR